MKKYLLGAAISLLMTSSAFAEKIGVSMALFDDNFLTVLRNGMVEQAKGMDGVEVQVEDAQEDVAKQLDQIKNFIASGVNAIIVNPVDTSATQAMSDAAAAANVPLVYVNREPINVDTLPDNQAFVASNEADSGTLETKEICRLFKEAGKTEAQCLRDHGPTVEPGGRHAHQGHRRRDRDAGMQLHQDHRQADLELAPRRGPEPDDQLAVHRQALRWRHRQQ